MPEKKWLVFYTKARWEKRVYEYLQGFGFNAFLPIISELHQWSDRRKKVQVPLFRSYIFVWESLDKIPEVLQIPGISWNIRLDGKPAILRQEEKDSIDQILNTGYSVSANSEEKLIIGDSVVVTEGPLKGINGKILKEQKGVLLVRVDSLDKILRIQIPEGLLKRIP
jgi:transcriptional antiterminator RfaH